MNKHTLLAILVSGAMVGCTTTPVTSNDSSETQPKTQEPGYDSGIVYEEENDYPEFEIDPIEETDSSTPPEETVKKVLPIEDPSGALIIGNKEYVYMPNVKRSFIAGVEPELELSEMTVTNIVPFERNGKKWVKFSVKHDDIVSKEFSAPVKRWRKVPLDKDATPSKDEEQLKQPVVAVWLQLGKIKENTDFLLVEESQLPYPFMLGKSLHRDLTVIDLSREFVQPKFSDKK